jgi:carbonic anhydrase
MRRRDFVALVPAVALAAKAAPMPGPDQVLKELLAGNERFASGKPMNPRRTPADFSKLASGQAPDAVIVGCSDSRVAPELLFDQGKGDLFVIRVAGNVVSGAGPTVKGSIAYAVVALGARLVMVLGHSQCGAVKSALERKPQSLPQSILDLVRLVNTGGEKDLDKAIVANVRASVEKLRTLEPTLTQYIADAKVKIVGGVYNLATGRVSVVA